MLKRLNRELKFWWFFLHTVRPVLRLSMGRLYVWRESPDWVVEAVATLPVNGEEDAVALKIIQTAREELNLRLDKAMRELNALLKKELEADDEEK